MNDAIMREKVRYILLHEWDPIGVSELTEAQDEYDSYVQPMCEIINQGKDATEIYSYLCWIVNDYMCLDIDEETNRIVASKLSMLH
ncbi:hypothetical protein [Brenneria corticis]|uniref:DUF1871 domain-containing protein n=1 Tax=Brenneria corticis TaxID=2173106 RepID=A0A2U1TMS9_9GAMM|nr:hypothetical protein [Brenneria sp. CFCC 11842]PWC10708.1 hypothetical protein DDT56_21230 [Brenneria sp. CFCC 11842]